MRFFLDIDASAEKMTARMRRGDSHSQPLSPHRKRLAEALSSWESLCQEPAALAQLVCGVAGRVLLEWMRQDKTPRTHLIADALADPIEQPESWALCASHKRQDATSTSAWSKISYHAVLTSVVLAVPTARPFSWAGALGARLSSAVRRELDALGLSPSLAGAVDLAPLRATSSLRLPLSDKLVRGNKGASDKHTMRGQTENRVLLPVKVRVEADGLWREVRADSPMELGGTEAIAAIRAALNAACWVDVDAIAMRTDGAPDTMVGVPRVFWVPAQLCQDALAPRTQWAKSNFGPAPLASLSALSAAGCSTGGTDQTDAEYAKNGAAIAKMVRKHTEYKDFRLRPLTRGSTTLFTFDRSGAATERGARCPCRDRRAFPCVAHNRDHFFVVFNPVSGECTLRCFHAETCPRHVSLGSLSAHSRESKPMV